MGILVPIGKVRVSSVLSELPGEEGVLDHLGHGSLYQVLLLKNWGGGSLSSGFSGGSFSVRGRVPTEG